MNSRDDADERHRPSNFLPERRAASTESGEDCYEHVSGRVKGEH